MKDLPSCTDLPSCCHLHNGSRAIKSSPPGMGFCAYTALVQIGKRQIRSSLGMPWSNNHETLSWRSWISEEFPMPLWRWKCSPQHQHKVQSGSDTLLVVCVFFSLRETSVTEQRQSIGQSWKPSSTYQSLIREKASRKINTQVIHVLTSCPPGSAFLKSYRTLHSLCSLQTFSNGWQRKLKL